MSTPIIVTENLRKEFASPEGTLVVVDDINIRVDAADSVAIVGASGSGKSTLLALLAGLELPSAGRVLVQGEDLSRLDEDARARLRGAHIGFVFQQFHLLPAYTALENAMLPLELAGEKDARTIALAALEAVGLAARRDHLPRQLSGGEQQRVALARACCRRPALLFADEPTGNLDQHTAASVIDLLFRMSADFATTLVLVTHDEHLAARCARRIRLDAGRIVDG
ncbi:MAG: ATP-binding cassette domain-containing protein [Gammaproteobacteria bacterium]|nr:ATP-binding cassette domain-containing protein [Gammaproteobacteria bacterium]MBI5618967.1 ATP-binding cassette domain-containing protein [Gammaproteobacteria bacterium]